MIYKSVVINNSGGNMGSLGSNFAGRVFDNTGNGFRQSRPHMNTSLRQQETVVKIEPLSKTGRKKKRHSTSFKERQYFTKPEHNVNRKKSLKFGSGSKERTSRVPKQHKSKPRNKRSFRDHNLTYLSNKKISNRPDYFKSSRLGTNIKKRRVRLNADDSMLRNKTFNKSSNNASNLISEVESFLRLDRQTGQNSSIQRESKHCLAIGDL
jgi:hypothetical protein